METDRPTIEQVFQWKKVRYGVDMEAWLKRDPLAMEQKELLTPLMLSEEWILMRAIINKLTNTEYLRMLIDLHIQRSRPVLI